MKRFSTIGAVAVLASLSLVTAANAQSYMDKAKKMMSDVKSAVTTAPLP